MHRLWGKRQSPCQYTLLRSTSGKVAGCFGSGLRPCNIARVGHSFVRGLGRSRGTRVPQSSGPSFCGLRYSQSHLCVNSIFLLNLGLSEHADLLFWEAKVVHKKAEEMWMARPSGAQDVEHC